MTVRILVGDCRQSLLTLPDQSVQTCITSPPYFGLRDYGHAEQIGLEQTPDAFVAELVSVFREVRRVLRDDGTLWLNLGDSYAAARGGTHQPAETLSGGRGGKTGEGERVNRDRHDGYNPTRNASAIGLKHKDLIGIPWRVAFALQADGWYLRQDIIWYKPNPMPESVRDRCTKAHEYIFLLSKSERYHYDADAIAEPVSRGDAGSTFTSGKTAEHLQGRAQSAESRLKRSGNKQRKAASARGVPVDDGGDPSGAVAGSVPWEGTTRNKRSVWTVTTKPFSGAHFATFPPALIEPCILAGSPKGGVVLDPFGGAGTTGLVADRLGRDAVLLELNPEYARMAEERIKAESPLFASVEVA